MKKVIYIIGTCILLATTAMLLIACPAGSVCSSQSQCAGGLYCDLFPMDLDGDGASVICEPLLGVDDPCLIDVQCEPELYCDVFTVPGGLIPTPLPRRELV